MKSNFKFIIIVSAILLASTVLLTACMQVIASDLGSSKRYDNSVISNDDGKHDFATDAVDGKYDTPTDDISIGNIPASDSPTLDGELVFPEENIPTSQKHLQEKFGAMYDISEDEKTITVISSDYLNNYWQSNYEKEVIHSLTTEEVYFIIQDSIRIYMEHDKVILAGFVSVSSDKQVAERFPYLDGTELSSLSVKSSLDREKIENDIHAIIMYRLRALSSPKAFFTGADAIRFVGNEPAKYSSMYPEAVFYIPGYSFDTDRDYILSIMGGNTNFTDLERFSDLFMVSIAGEPRIEFCPMQDSGSLEVFPTEDIYRVPVTD